MQKHHSQQQYQPYGQPQSSAAQYSTNGVHHDGSLQSSPDYTNGHTGTQPANSMDMNAYQQYAGYAPQHSQQQQLPPQHHRPYMPANQLPPLGMPSGMAQSMPPPHTYMQPPPPMPPPQQASLPPQLSSTAASTRAGTVTASGERKMFSNSERDGFRYSLEVVQQPQRARMCGFGDKDRRPITPPPCVRLVIISISTGKEVDINDFGSDPAFFVLQVDLWAETADREANVVRASSNSPAVSISSATTTSYPPPQEPQRHLNDTHQVVYMTTDGQQVLHTVPAYTVPMHRPSVYGAPGGYYAGMPVPGHPIGYAQPAQSNAMYTRNLIGSLTVNAAKLTDPDGKPGYWFVLQDLSVRTEGQFRLRMSFIDISSRNPQGGVHRGTAPVLAWTFSDKFQVYSAKKFPGVIESTPLSKCFASQGIKIPIRKDNKNDGGDDDDAD